MGQVIKRRRSVKKEWEELLWVVRDDGVIEEIESRVLFDTDGEIIGWGFENDDRRIVWNRDVSYEEAVIEMSKVLDGEEI